MKKTYCMSDIHGCFDEYKKALELINFSDTDTLYVLGDCVDRGPEPMRLLFDMMGRSNVFPIAGNHEIMAYKSLTFLSNVITEESIENFDKEQLSAIIDWMNVNGGDTTVKTFRDLDDSNREAVLDYFCEFDLYIEITVNGKDYVLIHAGLKNFRENRRLDSYSAAELLWTPPDYNRVYFKDKFLVTGHTPTRNINGVDEIFKKNNHIAIDCGCCFGGNLAVYCFETGETVYVSSNKSKS